MEAGTEAIPRSVVESDAVCVVGTGPVGLALSLRLADAGRQVILVDSGHLGAAEQSADLTGGEVVPAASAVDRSDPTLLASGALYQHLQPDYLVASRHLGSGGTSHRWLVRGRPGGERLVRLVDADPAAFAARPDLDIPGWVVPADQVIDRTDAALDFFGLGQGSPTVNAATDPQAVDANALRRGSPLPLAPDLLPDRNFRFARADIVHRTRLGQAAEHPAIQLLGGLHLVGIETDRGETVTALVVVDRSGTRTRITAGHYVLALGGIENTRQLLLACEEGHLADPHQVIGRWFCDHPHGRLGFFDLADSSELDHLGAWYDFQPDGGSEELPILRAHELAPAAAEADGLLRFSIELVGRPAGFRSPAMVALANAVDAATSRNVSALLGAVPGVARAPARSLRLASAVWRDRVHGPHLGGWSDPASRLHPVDTLAVEAMFEQRPSPDNRIRLSRRRDRFGRRLPLIHWSWSSKEIASINRSAELVGRALDATGRGTFVSMAQLGQGDIPRAGSGWHHMGGTRQSVEPDAGVVDGDNRVHGVANLTLAGSSIFPNTVGYANPTLIAVADALRVADRLVAQPSGHHRAPGG